MNLPNRITMTRILIIPFFIIFFKCPLPALIIFLLAVITDALDGFIARIKGQRTELGTFLDPLADKLLIAAGFVGSYMAGWIPFWIVVAVIGRDVILVLGCAVLYIITGALKILPTFLGKLTAVLQFGTILLVLAFNFWPRPEHYPRLILFTSSVMVAFAAVSLLHYIIRASKQLNTGKVTA